MSSEEPEGDFCTQTRPVWMGTQGHGAGLSHLSGDHGFVNIYAKEPQRGIPATPSQQRDPSPEHVGTVLRVTVGPQHPPTTVSPTRAKALHKN